MVVVVVVVVIESNAHGPLPTPTAWGRHSRAGGAGEILSRAAAARHELGLARFA